MSKELTVIIPAYNEEESLLQTVGGVRKILPDSQIIAVDDCSKDGTLAVLKKIALKDKKLKIISNKKNKGHGGSLKVGFKNSKTKYISFLDADLSYPPKYIPVMLEELKKSNLDIIWGNRFGTKLNEMPLLRKIGNKVLVFLLFLSTGICIPDCTSGERVIKKETINKLDIYDSTSALDFVCVISKRTIVRGLKYKTYPIDYYSRGGSSKLNVVKDFLRMAKTTILEK